MTDQEFVEMVIKAVVSDPDSVSVQRSIDELGVLLTVQVNPRDMGALIGRSGSTAKAIWTLVRIVGIKNGARVNLRIQEPAQRVDREGNAVEVPVSTKDRSVDEIVAGLI